jgi:hypothetical protein
MANRIIVIQNWKALILLAVFILLSFGLPMGLRALGAARWLDSQGFGAGAFLYLFIVCGLAARSLKAYQFLEFRIVVETIEIGVVAIQLTFRARSTAGSDDVDGLCALLYVIGRHIEVTRVSRARPPAILEDEITSSRCRTGAWRRR